MQLPIWPERFLEQQKRFGQEPEYKWMLERGMFFPWDRGGGPSWPGYDAVLRYCNGVLPTCMEDFARTLYADAIRRCWEHPVWNQDGMGPPDHLAEMFNQLELVLSIARWLHEGRQCFELDESTAFALLDTDFSDVPAQLLRMPASAFWLVLPPALRWTFALSDHDPTDPTSQGEALIEGYLVSTHVADSGQPLSVEALACGRGTTAPDSWFLGEPTLLHYFKFPSASETLADLCGHVATDPAGQLLDPRAAFARLLVGLSLYVHSVHPHIVTRVLEPPPPKASQKWKKKKRAPTTARVTQDAPRSIQVRYVGGPDQGHQRDDDAAKTDPASLNRRPPRPHVRAGHFAHTWVGGHDSKERHAELRWRRPTHVGDWTRIIAWESLRKGVLRVARTRPAVPGQHPQAKELLDG